MSIIFEKLRYKNFLSTGNYLNEISLNSHEVTVVSGKNGHGKSTMLDALCYCLFNKGFRNIPKGKFINSINGSGLLIEVDFSIGNKKYTVRRGAKPTIFEILVNGEMIDQVANVRDQQQYLEKSILGLNWKAFTQVVVLGSAAHVPFMQLKASDRREIVEELLDLQVFSHMRNILKDRFDDVKSSLVHVNSEIEVLKTRIELEQRYLNKSDKDDEDRLKKSQETIDETNGLIEIEKNSISKIVEEEISRFNIEDLGTTLTINKKKLSDLENIKIKLDHKISLLNKEILFFNDHSTCPTCNQEITDDWKTSAVSDRSDIIEEYEVGMKRLSDRMSMLNSNIEEIERELDDVKIYQNKIASHKYNISLHEKFIEKIQRDIDDSTKKTDIDADKSQLDENINQIVEKEKSKESYIETKELYTNAGLLLKDTGIKASIIRQYIPIINHFMTQYLSTMDFFVKFELDENFEESIKSRHLDDFKYANFSEGERRRIDISLIFTWRDIARKKNSMNTNLLILDEVFDSAMDSDGNDSLRKILKGMPNLNVFIITHNQSIMEGYDSDGKSRRLEFEKRKGFSYIKEK